MRQLIIAVVLAAATMFAAGAVLANNEMTKGEITKIDEAQAKLTIQHGPI